MILTSLERWKPVDAPVTNGPGERSAPWLRAVLAQFDVEGNPRYTSEPGVTWCNIFAWDASRALGCEIPHWISDSGVEGGKQELNVNRTLSWLIHVGHEEGWLEVDAIAAAVRASDGYPTVAVWANPNPRQHGHIAFLLPPRGSQMQTAQAGSTNFYDRPLRAGFGALMPIRFFTHD